MNERTGKVARIFLIDDHPAVRQGLKVIISQESYMVCGEAENSLETFERISSSGADIALLDLSLGEENGLELIAAIRKLGITVLVYSMHEDAGTIERTFTAGANGYVTKREMADVLLAALSDLQSGKRHVSPRAARSLADRALSSSEVVKVTLLSERERRILSMLGKGETNTDIAADLFISVRTVETYCARIIDKLELDGMKALRRYAIKSKQL